jgi:adenylate cyclase
LSLCDLTLANKDFQTCISTLATRHLAIGKCSITDLDQLRAPMEDVLGSLEAQLIELQRYKALYGALDPESCEQKLITQA